MRSGLLVIITVLVVAGLVVLATSSNDDMPSAMGAASPTSANDVTNAPDDAVGSERGGGSSETSRAESRPDRSNKDNVEPAGRLLDNAKLEVLLEQTQWLQDRGWGDTSSYHAFSNDELVVMARSNDAIASLLLAQRLAATDSARARAHATEALLLGKSAAITAMVRIIATESLEPGAKLLNVPAREEAFAWMVLAHMRGDPRASSDSQSLARDMASQDLDVRNICARATDIYSDLQRQRSALGLGPFDNAPPPLTLTDPRGMREHCSSWPDIPTQVCQREMRDITAANGFGDIPVYRCTLAAQ